MNAELDRVLEPFRPGFDADGFDVSVQEFVDDMLGPMLTTAFRRAAPAMTGVRIEHVHSE